MPSIPYFNIMFSTFGARMNIVQMKYCYPLLTITTFTMVLLTCCMVFHSEGTTPLLVMLEKGERKNIG